MDDRDELRQSFDPRTWMQDSEDEENEVAPARRRTRAAPAAARPPFFLALATAIGIFSVGAAGAFLTRADSPAATEVAAALEPVADESGAGASVAGEQP